MIYSGKQEEVVAIGYLRLRLAGCIERGRTIAVWIGKIDRLDINHAPLDTRFVRGRGLPARKGGCGNRRFVCRNALANWHFGKLLRQEGLRGVVDDRPLVHISQNALWSNVYRAPTSPRVDDVENVAAETTIAVPIYGQHARPEGFIQGGYIE